MTSKDKPTKAKSISQYQDDCPCQLDNILVQASEAIGHPDNLYYIDGFMWCERPTGVLLPVAGRDQLIARLTNSEQTAKQYDWLNEFVFEQYLNDHNWRYANVMDPSMGWWLSAEDWNKIIDRCSKGKPVMDRIFFNRVQYQVQPTKDINAQTLNRFDTVIRHILFPTESYGIYHQSYLGIVVYYVYGQIDRKDVNQRLFALMNAEEEARLWKAENDTLNEEQLEHTEAAVDFKKGKKLTLYIEDTYALLLRPQFLCALMSLGCFKVLRNGKEYDISTDPYIQV